MGGLFPIYKETGSGVMFVYALGAMRAVCVVCTAIDLLRQAMVGGELSRFDFGIYYMY